ncbi:uncharacterized protein TRIADDRAFT_3740, partial [Trichoplax adhaerens]
TCSNILSHLSLKLFVWIIGILALFGNLTVLYINLYKIKQRTEPVPMLLITNLAVSDLMMAGYMLIIGSADLTYHDIYAFNAEVWLRSFTCVLACFLCCTASLMSVLMMITISFDRYIYIAFPYSAKRLSPQHAKVIILIQWMICFVFVGLPVAYSYKADGDLRIYEYTSICMASNFRNFHFRVWIIGYLTITLICWLTTCLMYSHMFIAIHNTSRAATSRAHDGGKRIAMRLFAIVITDLISWVPYYAYMIQVMIDPTDSGSVVLQFAIIVALPINSAINPYLYTM